ncbi:MAG: hypothetical protein ACP5TY_11695 [Thermodesulforhabdaceae bacterium]
MIAGRVTSFRACGDLPAIIHQSKPAFTKMKSRHPENCCELQIND